MPKDPIITLEKISKKIGYCDFYLARRVEAEVEHAFLNWRGPDCFKRWFVPPDQTILSYDHDETQNTIILCDHLGDETKYHLSYDRDDRNTLIQMSGGRYFDDASDAENVLSFTVKFSKISMMSDVLGREVHVTFVQLLIQHPTVDAWCRAQGVGVHKHWTAAFERYVQRAEAR